jgi:hypothetical protein
MSRSCTSSPPSAYLACSATALALGVRSYRWPLKSLYYAFHLGSTSLRSFVRPVTSPVLGPHILVCTLLPGSLQLFVP